MLNIYLSYRFIVNNNKLELFVVQRLHILKLAVFKTVVRFLENQKKKFLLFI